MIGMRGQTHYKLTSIRYSNKPFVVGDGCIPISALLLLIGEFRFSLPAQSWSSVALGAGFIIYWRRVGRIGEKKGRPENFPNDKNRTKMKLGLGLGLKLQLFVSSLFVHKSQSQGSFSTRRNPGGHKQVKKCDFVILSFLVLSNIPYIGESSIFGLPINICRKAHKVIV